jgi:hypothetical protein
VGCRGSVTPLSYDFCVVLTTLRSPDARSSDARSSAATYQARLEAALEHVQDLVREADPDAVSGDTARAIVEGYSQIGRLAASGVALFTPVVVETGSYAKAGHSSAQDWLSSVSGTSAGAAKGVLSAAGRAATSPELTEALHEGELSADELKVITKTIAEAKESAGDLLELINEGVSHKELTDSAEQMRSAARSRETERLRRERIRATRHLRWHQDEDGGIRFSGFCDEVAWACVEPELEAEATRRWKAGGADGDSLEAHRLDAFIDLMGSGPLADLADASERPSRSAPPRTLVIINAESLRRGTTEGDEICEIEGIGTVSVAAATELIGEGGLQYLIKEGFDIKTVTKATRHVDQCIDVALLVRDRVCARPGCGNRLGLQRDHWRVDYTDGGPTELDNLCRLCPTCHAMKTNGGWRLTGGPGHWGWKAPANPPSAGLIARRRTLEAKRAQATRAQATRNKPRRT